MIIAILGRQPAIGIAELEALYGAEAVSGTSSGHALINRENIDFSRLGSSVKDGTVLTTIPGTNPQTAFLWLQKNMVKLTGDIDGKIKLGVSLYDLQMPVHKLNANILSLKKVLKKAGRSIRVVPNTEAALSSAQTYHNNLTDERGCEILLVRDGGSIIIARATNVQNIDSYTIRDRSRPKRDAFVGMLPPKLAQTIINLATGQKTNGVVLDPFCGTGVILQEALLMGYDVYGTDLVERMVDYSQKNLEWLKNSPAKVAAVNLGATRLEAGDATDHIWRQPIDIIACEGYLGQPLGGQNPSQEKLAQITSDCDTIMRGFLTNIGEQLQPGTRLCIAAPAWFVSGKTYRMPSLDDLENLGYTRIDFEHATHEDLIYRREDQVVGRELVVITRK